MTTYKVTGHHVNVDYGVDAGRGGMLWAVIGTIRRPNATFRAISHNPGRYLASSAAIFAILCLVSALAPSIPGFTSDSDALDGLGSGTSSYARSLVNAILQNLVFVAAIFWIGGRFGENRKFKDMFPVLSYCLIPMAFLVVAFLGMQLFVLPWYMHGSGYLGGGSLDLNPDLSPSFELDFAGIGTTILIQNAFTAFFMIWAFVLFVKAMKVSHGFGTGKAVGVVALAAAAAYALGAALATLRGLLLPPLLF